MPFGVFRQRSSILLGSRHSQVNKKVTVYCLGIVLIQESTREVRTVTKEEIEMAYVASSIKESNQMSILLRRSFNLEAVDPAIIRSPHKLDPLSVRYVAPFL